MTFCTLALHWMQLVPFSLCHTNAQKAAIKQEQEKNSWMQIVWLQKSKFFLRCWGVVPSSKKTPSNHLCGKNVHAQNMPWNPHTSIFFSAFFFCLNPSINLFPDQKGQIFSNFQVNPLNASLIIWMFNYLFKKKMLRLATRLIRLQQYFLCSNRYSL